MAKDTREVNYAIRTPVDEKNSKARVLKTDDADEIAGMFSQTELDGMVQSGALSGDWKASSQAGQSSENESGELTEASLTKQTKAELLETAKAEGVEGVTEDNNKAEIIAKILARK